MKLTVVGGGSTYTPELIDGIAGRRTSLAVDEIVLVDPDEHRLSLIGPFSQRLLEHAGHSAKVRSASRSMAKKACGLAIPATAVRGRPCRAASGVRVPSARSAKPSMAQEPIRKA